MLLMISKFDINQLEKDLSTVYNNAKKIDKTVQDNHLKKIIKITNFFRIIGILTMWYCVNPLSIICLTLYTMSRWTMIGHHSCHGGYDTINKNHNRFKFGLGKRRFWDWFDWFLPEAWNYEHNNKHHYHLGEKGEDPDLVEDNVEFLRNSTMPKVVKYIVVFFVALTWRWSYYASNTYKELSIKRYESTHNTTVFKGKGTCMIYTPLVKKRYWFSMGEFLCRVIGPYLIYNFVILPLPLLILSKKYFINGFINIIISEFVTNLYTFTIIATNHTGEDVYRFNSKCDLKNKGDFYLRQILGSVNYTYGNDFIDYLHGFLNYQIEHHVFPDLSMYAYQSIAPEVKNICKKHNVPYIQENVFTRLYKTVQIFVGDTSMKIL